MMRTNLNMTAIAAVLAIVTASCKKVETAEEPRITLGDGGPIELTSEESSQKFSFSTNEQWYIAYDPVNWLEITPQGGEPGDMEVTLAVEANDTGASREAEFTIVARTAKETVTVVQLAKEPTAADKFDSDFLAFLISKYDTDSDSELDDDEMLAITELVCTDSDAMLTSLKGVKELSNLEVLNISYNTVGPELDLSGMTSLKELYCDHNLLTDINLSGCSSLEILKANDMTGYILESVNLDGCAALKSINIVDGAVAALDVTDCTALEDINIAYNSIPELDFSNNPALVNVTVRRNPMDGFALDLSGKSDMLYLNCSESGLAGLDISGCPELRQLIAHANRIPSVDVKASTRLYEFNMYSNELTSVDLSACTELATIDVASNRLTALDLSNNKNITSLTCWHNEISGELDLSGCSKLMTLNAFGNKISSVNLEGCTSLSDIDLRENQLTAMDLTDCLGVIRSLTVNDNELTELDLSGSSIAWLYAQNNELSTLRLEGCTGLNMLNCSSNLLTSLDLSDSVQLTELEASVNNISDIKFPSSGTLVSVTLGGNKLSRIDLRGCENINSLTLASNEFEQLSLNYLKNVAMLDVSSNRLKSLDLSSMVSVISIFCTGNGMESLYINENANPGTLRVDPTCKVYYVPAKDYDDTDTGNWGDTEINPWN